MRILIIENEVFPGGKKPGSALLAELSARSFARHERLARAFMTRGDSVLFVSQDPSPKGSAPVLEFRSENGLSKLLLSRDEKKDFFSRAFAEAVLLSENAAGIAGLFRPNVVFSAGFLPLTVFPARKIARLSGAVLVSELPCSAPKLFRKLHAAKTPLAALSVLEAARRTAIKKSAALFAPYPASETEIPLPKAFFYLLPPFEKAVIPSEKAKALRASLETLREGGTFVLAASGTFQKGCSWEALLAAAGRFDRKFSLVFLTDGESKTVLSRKVREQGLSNVIFLDFVSEAEQSFVLSAASAVFVSESTVLGRLVSESDRFLTVLSAGRPVLAVVRENAALFRQSEGAVLTLPNDIEGISRGIELLRNAAPEKLDLLGQKGKTFAESRDFEHLFPALCRRFDELIGQQKEDFSYDPCYRHRKYDHGIRDF